MIKGRRAKVAGKVCMNMFMIDVSDIDGVEIGDEVVLIGSQGEENITADELATLSQTINYEVTTRINSDLPRFVVD